jgi:serine/threonine protein phosphatase PrpC
MKLNAAGKSHIGMKRKINEDNYLIRPDLGLYVIADGMGGHRAGEVASRMVVETIENYWQKTNTSEAPSLLYDKGKDVSDMAKHLMNSLYFANTIVHEAQKKPEFHRMGSTVSAVLVEKDIIWSANVGDSPVYLLDQGRHLRLVSEEHSLEAEQKSQGLYDSLNSTNPMIKNMLTRVVGLSAQVDVYIMPMRPEPGDMVLLCSDGLTNFMPEPAIKEVLTNTGSLEEKVDLLIDGANNGGGGDNISVILLEVLKEGRWEKLKGIFK